MTNIRATFNRLDFGKTLWTLTNFILAIRGMFVHLICQEVSLLQRTYAVPMATLSPVEVQIYCDERSCMSVCLSTRIGDKVLMSMVVLFVVLKLKLACVKFALHRVAAVQIALFFSGVALPIKRAHLFLLFRLVVYREKYPMRALQLEE